MQLRIVLRWIAFNSRPHKEVDEFRQAYLVSITSFNSRPHKEVDRLYPVVLPRTAFFQFTTSQGGRR